VAAINNWERLGGWIEGNPLVILIIVALFTVGSLHYAQDIEMATGTETYVDENSRLYVEYDHLYQDKFGIESIVVLIEGDSAIKPGTLGAIDRLTTHMETVDQVLGTFSIAEMIMDFQFQETGVRKIPDSQYKIYEIIKILETRNSDTLRSILPDERHTMVSIEVPTYIEDYTLKEVLRDTESAVEMAEFPPGVDIVVSGDAALRDAMEAEMNESMGILLMLSGVLMIVALLLVFRHVHLSLLPLPIVLLGIIWTFGIMGFLQIPMTMVSMAAFPVLIGLGIDYAIQFHNRLSEEFQSSKSAAIAVINTVSHVAPAVLIALTITATGFVSLFSSTVPMINDFGLLCLIGIVMCYLSSMFVGVTILYQSEKKRSYDGHEKEINTSATGIIIRNLVIFITQRWQIILVLAIVLSGLGMYADTKVGIETDFKEWLPSDLPPLVEFQHLHRIFGGTDELNLIVLADDVTDPETLEWMDYFGTYIVESREKVYGATSLATLIKTYGGGDLPRDKSRVEAILDTIPDDAKYAYIDGHDTAQIRLDIGEALENLGQEGIKKLQTEIDKDVIWFESPPSISVIQTGDMSVMNSVVEALTSGRMKMTLLGLVLIFFVLLLIYRDLIKALLPVLPMIMVISWMGGVMYIFDMKYTPLTATLGALILGVGSEYAVLTMERFYEENEKASNPMEALITAMSSIGAAIVASGLTTVFGFSSLMASPFGIISNFGIVTVLSVVFALLATFTIFPMLMIRLEYWRAKAQNKIASDIDLDDSLEDN